MLLTDAFLGHVQILPSAVKWLNFGKFLFFFEFPLFCIRTPSNSFTARFNG